MVAVVVVLVAVVAQSLGSAAHPSAKAGRVCGRQEGTLWDQAAWIPISALVLIISCVTWSKSFPLSVLLLLHF